MFVWKMNCNLLKSTKLDTVGICYKENTDNPAEKEYWVSSCRG